MNTTGYFLPTAGEPRVRRARDAGRVGLGSLVLLVAASNVIRLGALQDTITRVVDALPGWAELAFWSAYAVAGVYAMVIVVAVLVRVRQDPGAARDVVLAVLVAGVVALIAMRWRENVWPVLLPEIGAEDPEPLFPMVRVAVVTATVLAISPHVSRPVRRFGTSMILLGALAGFGLDFGFPTDALAAVSIGAIAAGGVALAFGSPSGLPDKGIVAVALGELGVEVTDLAPARDESWGVRRLVGQGADGVPIEVKAYGRDAADTQLAAKAWRALWYRDAGPDLAVTRMQAVEHEALMAMFVDRLGVATTTPLTAGRADDEVAILAVRRPGAPLARADDVTDETLVAVWRDVARMHDRDVAHGSLSTETVLLDGSGHLFDDFAAASLAAGGRVHLDVVSLAFSLSEQVGAQRAVTTALAGLGTERLAAALPYFQLPALSRAMRRSIDKPKPAMTELRNAVAAAVDIEPPEQVKLRRVTVGSILMSLLLLFAANALISQLAGIDYAAVWSVVKDASWLALLIALPVAHLTFIPEATGMMAAVGRPLPLRPLVVLQLSARFVGLAVPSAAGRVAMNSAFLIKFGVSRTVAVVQGAIDGVSGFIVEAGILAIALLVSDQSFALGGDVNWQRILVIVVALAVASAIAAFAIPKIRALILPILQDALGSVAGVIKDPRRAGILLLSNVLSRLAFGVALWIILRAIGVADISIAVAFTVTIATNLLAGLVPIPGGIGVAEAVLVSWLVLVGVPEAPAFAATIMYRMWTFYVPAVEGLFAMRWLQARDYL